MIFILSKYSPLKKNVECIERFILLIRQMYRFFQAHAAFNHHINHVLNRFVITLFLCILNLNSLPRTLMFTFPSFLNLNMVNYIITT